MTDFRFNGRCWLVGDFVPTDQIVKSHRVFLPLAEIARYVLEDANPAFAAGVNAGDVLVAGRHFGQSSGRAIAVRALRATGISCVVAESFARTFYRNAFEVGLPILEVPGIRAAAVEGDVLEVDVPAGVLKVQRTGQVLQGHRTDPFLLEMLRAGGVIAIGSRLAEGEK
jgi:3-isopropylmalate/(R)-2-methylmalate dehydratase small subunit